MPRAYGLKEVSTPLARLVEHYDLLLAWDYESINTSIADSALKLKQALAAVGLAAGHNKTLHVIAHSMGGPVTRWFVEREGGNRVVQKVVLGVSLTRVHRWPSCKITP